MFRDVLTPGDKPSLNRRNEQRVGHVEWDRQTGVYRLVNDEGSQWQARSKDNARQVTAGKGQSLPLSKGAMIHLGVTDVPEGYSNSMEGLE